jgi:hypothetical protein
MKVWGVGVREGEVREVRKREKMGR